MKIETRKMRDILTQFLIEFNDMDEQLVFNASDEAIILAQSIVIEDYIRNWPNNIWIEYYGALKDIFNLLKITVERERVQVNCKITDLWVFCFFSPLISSKSMYYYYC